MKIALIVNPESGRKKARKLLPQVEKKLAEHRIDCDVFISLNPEHISLLASELKIKTYDAVVIMGGDGTNYLILNALLSSFNPDQLPPLGIIPVGSGNSFTKDLGIHSLDDALSAIITPQPRKVDVCSFSQKERRFYFVNLTGLGFVTDVAKTADNFKFLKDFSYLVGVIYRTLNLKFHHIEMVVDNEIIEGENCFVEFCNSRYTGGNMMMAPEASIDDGMMDIIICGRLSRLSLLKTLPKIFTGRHLAHPAVTCIKARKAVIHTKPVKTLLPDGEVFGSTPAHIDIHPGLVRYL